MYKFLLCWRYLRTRYIALASIVSVMLGVATLIVVNSVMAGFATEMRDRIHGVLADVTLDATSLDGFSDAEGHMALIRQALGDKVVAMTPTVQVPGMMSFRWMGRWVPQPVTIIGIEPEGKAAVGEFAEYLQNEASRQSPSFELGDEAREQRRRNSDAVGDALPTLPEMPSIELPALARPNTPAKVDESVPAGSPRDATKLADPFPTSNRAGGDAARGGPPPAEGGDASDPFDDEALEAVDPAAPHDLRAILGFALATYRHKGEDVAIIRPGDDVNLTFPTAGTPPRAADDVATVVDLIHTGMSEYDSSFVYVNLKVLQQRRGMIDPRTGIADVTSIQIKLRDYADAPMVVARLRELFPPGFYSVSTWEDKQGPLLAAVQIEAGILNVLLFLIIAVAGFGILAIFFMIVVEKTRDIGILKALGASSRGVMGIFLSYGLLLGLVGCGIGTVLGLVFVHYINEIEWALSLLTGQKVFNPDIYYFDRIPTLVNPLTVLWIAAGSLAIAVAASVLPARRAARFQPVEALRWE
jgi:lipoprotein-releasing system permease protein